MIFSGVSKMSPEAKVVTSAEKLKQHAPTDTMICSLN
jgi:hypothetical protein